MAWRWMLDRNALLCFVALAFLTAEKATPQVINPSCQEKCGNVSIPYPFGMREDCYLSKDFNISCNGSGIPFLVGIDPWLQIKSISVDSHELVVYTPVARACYNKTGPTTATDLTELTVNSTKFPFSHTRNSFTAIGCDTIGMFVGSSSLQSAEFLTGCLSFCESSNSVAASSSCSGAGCCQTPDMTTGLLAYSTRVTSILNHSNCSDFNPCDHAFFAEDSYYVFQGLGDLKDFSRTQVPTVLDWSIGNHSCSEVRTSPSYACKAAHTTCVESNNGPGYYCRCSPGYEGNPYIPAGCEDVCMNRTCKPEMIKLASIAGAVLLAVLITGIFVLGRMVRKKMMEERRNKYFRRNGGPILQESLSKLEVAHSAFKVFTAEEMQAATNNFAEDRIVGRGGFGVVYMGKLSDGREVAIKKSKSVDQTEIDQFVNEVVLLSKIQHQSVVGFYGCCLETSKPLLVYEYINNGTLLDHLYCEDESQLLPWESRLNIAVQTAGVLGYLHQDHRPPIIHSDIKPQNILLDNNYNAKVSDFGISKMTPENEIELYTKVKGTWGYLDPEFLQTSQLTDKSDVYSFGVVLLELLTGQRVLSFLRPEKDRTLVNYFQSSVTEGSLLEILDKHITNQENVEELKIVAKIADRCTSVRAVERPTMKEVAMELGSLWIEVKNRSDTHRSDVEGKSGTSIGNAAEHLGNTSASYGDSTSTVHILSLHIDGGR